MAVITISRQMGSLGRQVADEISLRLNFRVVWREVINEAASRAGVPEVALATIDELDLLGIRPSIEARKAYHDSVRDIMHELAREDNVVIVGRAGQVILQGYDNALHVRLYAPIDMRIERIAQRQGISQETARGLVEASDLSRQRYLKKYYHARLDDPYLYDMMINTAHLTSEAVASIVCEMLLQRQKVSK